MLSWLWTPPDWLSWGLVSASVLSVEDAWFADRLGERPQLSGRIRAKNGVWAGIAGFVTPFAGIWLASRSRAVAFYIGALSCALQAAACVWCGRCRRAGQLASAGCRAAAGGGGAETPRRLPLVLHLLSFS